MYHYTECGLKNIWLANGFRIAKTAYGDGVSIENADGLDHAIAAAIVRKKGVISGLELRFLRHQMGLSQGSLANLIGNNVQSVALWEKHGKLPKWADKLVRLIYMGHSDGNETIRSAITMLNDMDRVLNQKIVFEESESGWREAREQALDELANQAQELGMGY